MVFNVEEPEVWKWRLLRRVCQILAITPLFRYMQISLVLSSDLWLIVRSHCDKIAILLPHWHRYIVGSLPIGEITRRGTTLPEISVSIVDQSLLKKLKPLSWIRNVTVSSSTLIVYTCISRQFHNACFKSISPLRLICLCDSARLLTVDWTFACTKSKICSNLLFCNPLMVILVTRMITLAWTIIAASRATAGYGFALTDYLKSLQFQDYVVYHSEITLYPPKRLSYWVSLIWHMISIGMLPEVQFQIGRASCRERV